MRVKVHTTGHLCYEDPDDNPYYDSLDLQYSLVCDEDEDEAYLVSRSNYKEFHILDDAIYRITGVIGRVYQIAEGDLDLSIIDTDHHEVNYEIRTPKIEAD